MFINSIEDVKYYESLNPFNIDNITNNYYFKFDKINLILTDKYNQDQILWSKINCQSDCVKKEQFSIKNNNSYYIMRKIDSNQNLKIQKSQHENYDPIILVIVGFTWYARASPLTALLGLPMRSPSILLQVCK